MLSFKPFNSCSVGSISNHKGIHDQSARDKGNHMTRTRVAIIVFAASAVAAAFPRAAWAECYLENVASPQEIADGWTIHEDLRVVKQVDSAPTSRAVAATGLSTAKRRRFRCAACLTTSGPIASGRTCCSRSSRRCRSRYARPPQAVAACPSYPPMRSHNLPTLRTKCSTRISALTPGHVRRSGPLLFRFRGRGDAESHWSARSTSREDQ